ncbi:hypothetical protein ACTFIV_007355 [Dictyostelium citrinum]
MTGDTVILESLMNKTNLKNEFEKSNNLNNDNSNVFFKIWRNLVIRNIILSELKYFNLFYHKQSFDIAGYKSFPFKRYLREIEIQFFKIQRDQLVEIIKELPNNITGLILKNLNYLKGPTIHITDLDSFNSLGKPFTKGLLPSQLTVFSFDEIFNLKIKEIDSFPSNLKYLEFGKYFNHSLNSINEDDEDDEDKEDEEDEDKDKYKDEEDYGKSILPNNLLELKFHPKSLFNQIIYYNTLPKTLVKLTFGLAFNQELKVGILPDGLKELEFGYLYNQPIRVNVLPKGLLKLKFGNSFNHSLANNILPSTLEVLKFGSEFNQKIHGNDLPKGLKEISFDSTSVFNQSIDSCNIVDCSSSSSSINNNNNNKYCKECGDNGTFSTLKNLTKLDIGYGFQHSLTKNSIPNSVKYLSLGGWLTSYSLANVVNTGMNPTLCKSIPPNVLPNSIVSLRVDPSYMIKKGSIPESVTKVDGLNYKFSKFLPLTNLKKLKLNDDFNEKLKGALDLPKDLQVLDMGGHFNEIIPPNSLPSSIEKLKLSTNFSKPLKFDSLPISIRNLYLGISFNDPVLSLPPFLETLNFGETFNLPFNSNILPKSLRSLRFGSSFDQMIITIPEQFQFPQSLTLLELGHSFSHSINSNWLSKTNIKTLIIKSTKAYFSLPLPDPTIKIFIFNSNSNFIKNSINQSIFINHPTFLINSIKIIDNIHFSTLFPRLSKL